MQKKLLTEADLTFSQAQKIAQEIAQGMEMASEKARV